MKKRILVLLIVFSVFSCYVLNNPFDGYLFSNDILARRGTITIGILEASTMNNKEFIFYLYTPSVDNTLDYVGRGSFIIQDSKGSSIAYDTTSDEILKLPYGKFVKLFGYINDNSYPILSETATNLSDYNTLGFFGGGRRLLKLNGNCLIEGISKDYQYDSQLTIYDDLTNDNFASGKFIRIIHDNFNLTDASPDGFDLIPIAKDLKEKENQFPSYPYFFIDPERGEFILPRPIYWSKMSNYNDIVQPEIADTVNYQPTIEGYPSHYQGFSSSGIFDFCYKILLPGSNDTLNQDSYTIKPLGNNLLNWNKGSLSAWVKLDSGGDSSGYISFIGETNQLKLQALSNNGHFYIRLYISEISDNIPDEFIIDDALEDSWVHIFAIWNMEGQLTHSKHIKVFVNGNLVFSSTKSIDLSQHNFIIKSFAHDGFSVGYATTISLDNLMIWNHVICDESNDYIPYIYLNKDNPSTESAIHPCYTKKYNYHPTTNIKVGYYSGGQYLWPDIGEPFIVKNKILINGNLNINLDYSLFNVYTNNN